MTWQPIENLPTHWQALTHANLHALADVWQQQRAKLENTQSYSVFLTKMRRKIAIETGVIERLYTIDRGVTRLLIEHGIDAALIRHGTTDKPAAQVVAMIRDHDAAMEQVFDYVGSQRPLSTSFIKQLHQLLTRNQPTTEAVDQFGYLGEVELIRGDWKLLPNNPTRGDGSVYYYAPPEQVSVQMDQLITWHLEHIAQKVSPEVEAAWLHHRFAQIHPFQDGNGRVARSLATLVFLKAGWFPLVVLSDQQDENESRKGYITALEKADDGDLKPLVDLFAEAQKQAFLSSLSLSEEAIAEAASYRAVIDATIDRIQQKQTLNTEEAVLNVQVSADQLFNFALSHLDEIKREIETALRRVGQGTAQVDSAAARDARAAQYRYQIVETAKQLNYFANLSAYKSWLRLSIRLNDLQTEILLSFHPLGREPKGVMMCAACAYRRSSSGDHEPAAIQNLEPLSSSAFDFTYQESRDVLQARFSKWLDDVITLGLDYWRKSI